MLALYHSPISTCSQKVRLCLHEKGLDFESRLVDLGASEHLTPAYLAINPNGVVPTLVHDDVTVLDSSVIMEYLDEAFPDWPLMPSDLGARARVRAWMRYIEEVPTVAIRYPSFNMVLIDIFSDQSPEEFAAAADIRPLRKHFYQQMGQTGFDEKDVANSLERLRQTAERMQAALGATAFIAGPELTIADLAVVPTFDRLSDLGLTDVWKGLDRVEDWWQAIRDRPAFDAAFYPGSRLSEVYTW